MKIVIDGHNLSLLHGTGIASYGRRLLSDLASLGHQVGVLYEGGVARDADLAEILFFDTHRAPLPRWRQMLRRIGRLLDAWAVSPWLTRIARPVPVRGIVLRQFSTLDVTPCDRIIALPDLFERAARRFRTTGRLFEITVPDDVDVVHWTSFLPIRARNARNIYTVHDIIPMKLPFTTQQDKRGYLRMLRRLAATADGFTAVSDSARQDFIMLTRLCPDRIVTTHQSLGIDVPPPSNLDVQPAHTLDMFGLTEKGFFVFVGALEPKKNVARLLEAYIYSGIALPLVLVGASGWMNAEELAMLGKEDSPIRERVLVLGYQPRDILYTLIRGARALVFPSLYEGFGLPVLEAMALGTAVLTSDAGSLPEVAGDAALLVDPLSVASIRAGLQALAYDDQLVASHAAAGRERAHAFSPAAIQARLRDAYARFCPAPVPMAAE